MSSLLPPLGASNLDGLISGSSPHCGKLFTQPILKNGKKLDDEIGYSPVLIVRNKLPKNIIPKIPVLDGQTHSNLIDVLNSLDASAVLVRPDKYIADSAKSENEVANLAVVRIAHTPPKYQRKRNDKMKLATLKTGGRDGTPVLVSRDMKKMVLATSVALTLRDAIENWTSVEPDLQNLANKLEAEEVETIVYDPKTSSLTLTQSIPVG